MKLKTLLIINSVMTVPTGIACVLSPASLLGAYGITLVPMGLVIYQLWGATLIGIGMLTWFARNTKETGVQKALALSLFMTYAMSGILAIRGQFAGANSFGWSTVVLYFLFALSFGYFQFIKLRASSSTSIAKK